jgi:urease accessory protein
LVVLSTQPSYHPRIITSSLPGIMRIQHTTVLKRAATLAIFAAPTLAQAHPGHGAADLMSGIQHPLLGMDHLLAMVAVGLWAVQLGGRAKWVVPAAFVGAMALGGALAMAGYQLPGVEQGILASVLVLGALIAASVRLPLWLGSALVGAFALCHGQSHAVEMPVSATGISYAVGFIVTTIGLHGIGIGLGSALRQETGLRATGAAIAVAAVLLAMRLL